MNIPIPPETPDPNIDDPVLPPSQPEPIPEQEPPTADRAMKNDDHTGAEGKRAVDADQCAAARF